MPALNSPRCSGLLEACYVCNNCVPTLGANSVAYVTESIPPPMMTKVALIYFVIDC